MSFFSGSSRGRRPVTFTIPPTTATTKNSRRCMQGERQGGCEGRRRSSVAQGGSESTWTDHKESLHAGKPPRPSRLLIYTHKHSHTHLYQPSARTHTMDTHRGTTVLRFAVTLLRLVPEKWMTWTMCSCQVTLI